MTEEQKAVWTWMAKAGQRLSILPIIPAFETRKLRARLILEEALETIGAMGFEFSEPDELTAISEPPNLVETADGLADLLVVLLGTACAFGIDLGPIFQEVMASNESKFSWTDNDLQGVHGTGWSMFQIGPGQICVVDDGGKVQKPPTYFRPALQPLLDHQPAIEA